MIPQALDPTAAGDALFIFGAAVVADVAKAADMHVERFGRPDGYISSAADGHLGLLALQVARSVIAGAIDGQVLLLDRALQVEVSGAVCFSVQVLGLQVIDFDIACADNGQFQVAHV